MKWKKYSIGIVLAAILGWVLYTYGISSFVPLKVKSAFVKKFPDAKKVRWEKEAPMEWEAEFELNGIKYSSNFLKNGTWLETEHVISQKDTPKSVMLGFEKEFPGYIIEDVELAETVSGVVYEFEAEKGEDNIEISIDSHGTLISKKESKELEEEND